MAIQADPTVPAAGVDGVLITDALYRRGKRDTNRTARQAFITLAEVMANAPERLPQTLCNLALELCSAGTAGISMLRQDPNGEEYFSWEALAGVYADFVGGRTPRDFSPCGTALDRGATQLYSYPERHFTYFRQFSPVIVEGLVVPFYAQGKPLGTIWVVSHDERGFDAGHAGLMEDLAKFCGAAVALVEARMVADTARSLTEVRAQSLTEANKVKDEFVSLVAHELRSPVATIFGNSRLLLDRGARLESADIGQALKDIAQESLRLNRALEDLLVLARPEQGGPVTEPVHVSRIAGGVVADHVKIYRDRPLKIEAGVECLASGSPDYVEQVLHNLISNAEKYSPPSEPIVVAIGMERGKVHVTVKDHGFGVEPAEAEHIFEMFYRTGGSMEKASGMGIGLAVCRRLVEAQGGEIWVVPGKDGGSEFCFTLPAYGEVSG